MEPDLVEQQSPCYKKAFSNSVLEPTYQDLMVDECSEGLPRDRLDLWSEVFDGVEVREVHAPRVGLLGVSAELLGVHAEQQDFYALDLLEEQDNLRQRQEVRNVRLKLELQRREEAADKVSIMDT